jgi:ribonuclease P protein component
MLSPSQQFTRELRLLTAKDYSRVFDNPIKVYNKSFTLLARSNNLEHPRLGLVIAKKNLKLATQRNWLKRQLREGFRLNQSGFKNYDIVILTRRDIAVLSKTDIIRFRDDIFKRLQRKCNKY